MAADKTTIANVACLLLGTDPITSLDENVKAARTLKALWDVRRDASLRARLWRFALVRGLRGKDADAPVFGFDNAFTLPADCLRLVQVGTYWVTDFTDYRTQDNAPWMLEGRTVLTDLSAPLPLRWISRIEDTTRWDATFDAFFAADIAWHACEAITGSSSKKADCERASAAALSDARRANAIETPPRDFTDGPWLLARSQF